MKKILYLSLLFFASTLSLTAPTSNKRKPDSLKIKLSKLEAKYQKQCLKVTSLQTALTTSQDDHENLTTEVNRLLDRDILFHKIVEKYLEETAQQTEFNAFCQKLQNADQAAQNAHSKPSNKKRKTKGLW